MHTVFTHTHLILRTPRSLSLPLRIYHAADTINTFNLELNLLTMVDRRGDKCDPRLAHSTLHDFTNFRGSQVSVQSEKTVGSWRIYKEEPF